MAEGRGILSGLPAVAGKPVHVGFDGGRLTSDAGILLLSAVEQRLKIAERLAACLEDPLIRSGCGTNWQTFITGGVCPGCDHKWQYTACLQCAGWSPHEEWYVTDDEDR